MIRNAEQLIDCIRTAVITQNCTQQSRIIVREGDFGPERVLEHVKVRQGRFGMEIILQASVRPNEQ